MATSGFDPASFDADTRGVVERKGFKTVGDVMTAYTNLEKITGVDRVAKPTNGEISKWFGEHKADIGVPDKPEAYALPKIDLPQGMEIDKGLLESAQKFAHERNIPQDLFNEFAGFVMQDRIASFTGQAEADARDEADTTVALKKEWGSGYDQKVELAKMAARALKVDDETMNKLNDKMGSATLIKHFAQLGDMLGEKQLVSGDGLGFGTEQGDAKRQLANLKLDAQFMKTLQDQKATGHEEAKQKWMRLHAAAEGEKAA